MDISYILVFFVLFQPIYLTFEEDDRITALELQTEKDNNESCATRAIQEKTRATGEKSIIISANETSLV